MKIVSQSVSCGNCSQTLAEEPDGAPSLREPCPRCGSMSRKFEVGIQNELQLKKKLKLKGWHPGGKKPFIEMVLGDDWHHMLRRWRWLQRIMDRDNDRYEETITDPDTGKVVEVREALREHVGHGSAKKKSKP